MEPKTVKVGIGLAKGKAIHAYIDLQNKWVIQVGSGRETARERFETKVEGQKRFRELKSTAPERKYPERLPYFTFSHIASDGDFEPDWEVIETHGPIPTEIDIIFIRDDPFSASYQLWTATERKCEGDGLNALRVCSLATTDQEKADARAAESRGERYYAIKNGCWTKGCQYSLHTETRPAPCRPIGRLLFQLLNSPRLGGTAVFNTAGYKSISQIFSSIEIFKRATGRGNPDKGFVAGIPLKMVLRPYRTSHDGKAVTQYGVSLEYRAESVLALKHSLVEHAVNYRIAGAEPLKQLENGSVNTVLPEIHEPPEYNARAITAEFIPDAAQPEVVDPDPVDAESGPGGALEHAWDEHEPPVASTIQLDTESEIKAFYDLCRSRGMTDSIIADKLGAAGFEKVSEITAHAIPDLMLWAAGYGPNSKQGSLL